MTWVLYFFFAKLFRVLKGVMKMINFDSTFNETYEQLNSMNEELSKDAASIINESISPRLLRLTGRNRGSYLLKLDTLLKGLDTADAYYNSEWTKYWLDGMTAEEAGMEFSDDDDYFRMLKIFEDTYSKYIHVGYYIKNQEEAKEYQKLADLILERDFGITEPVMRSGGVPSPTVDSDEMRAGHDAAAKGFINEIKREIIECDEKIAELQLQIDKKLKEKEKLQQQLQDRINKFKVAQ